MGNDNSITKADIVISVTLGIIAAVFIGISIFIFVDTNIRYKRYDRVTAVISNVEHRRHRRSHYYKADYKYSVNEKNYTYKDPKRYSFKPVAGNKVIGYYDPDKPQIFYPDKRYDGLTAMSLIGVIFTVCTIGSVIEMRTKDDRERAKALHGIIRGINLVAFAILAANLGRWNMTGFVILISGIFLAFAMIFDSIHKLRRLKDQYRYY